MTDVGRVLIVGGGPAGMTAAIALARSGIAAEIVEIEDDWRPAGVGLLLQSPPLRALKTLGLYEQCVAAGEPHAAIELFGSHGDPVGTFPQFNVNEPEAPPSVAMSRVTLHGILVDALRELGTPVRTGTTVARLAQDRDGVDVELTDGSRERFDLVLGADGLHSRIRDMVLPGGAEPSYTGQVIWRGAFERPAELDGYRIIIHGPHRLGLVPLSATTGYIWMLDSTMPLERPPREALVDLWQERLANYPSPVPAVAAQLREPDRVDFRALQTLLLPPPWHSGRVVLVGDAAHATSPQLAFGIGLAIEDAVVLADLLRSEPELSDALGTFTERRFPRCRLVVENSRRLGEWEQHPDAPGADPIALIRESMSTLAQPI